MDGDVPSAVAGPEPSRILGRYFLYDVIASGGMAQVHLGRLLGAAGFSRIVAIKRMHAHLASDPNFVAMFTDEARLAARVRHPNVVQTLDVGSSDGELFLVLEYAHGVSFARLLKLARKAGVQVPIGIALRVVCDLLAGLHAAHEATNERGEPINLVHRDVSPHNVLVGADGVGRVLDFGIAKAFGRMQVSAEGELKGKIAYVAPEQFRGDSVDRRTDIYSASVVLWEALVGRQLFSGSNEAQVISAVLARKIPPIRAERPDIPPALEAALLRGTSFQPEGRFATAAEMSDALEHAAPVAGPRDVASWVRQVAGHVIDGRSALVSRIESGTPVEPHHEHPGTPSGPRSTSGLISRTGVTSRDLSTQPPSNSRRAAAWGVVGGFIAAAVIGGFLVLRGGSKPEAPAQAIGAASDARSGAPSGPTPDIASAAPPATAASASAAETASAAASGSARAAGSAAAASKSKASPTAPRTPGKPSEGPSDQRPDDLFGRN